MGAVLGFIGELLTWPTFWMVAVLVFSQPLVIVSTCVALKLAGVSKPDRAAWALKQAGRSRAAEVLRSLRGDPKL